MASSNCDYATLKPEYFKCNPYSCVIDGSGGMGDVYKAFDTRTNETVAVKILKQNGRNNAAECVKEGKQLRIAMACPHVINLIGIMATWEITGLVMEFAENGSLDKLIHNSSIKIEKDLTFRFLSEIASGIHFLHNLGIDQRVLHRDIKPKNVLLDMDFHIKICDFGTSVCSTVTIKWNENRTHASDTVRTLAYCAPERLKSSSSTSKVDIYAFGVTAVETIVRERPYDGELPEVVRSNIIAGVTPNMEHFPQEEEFDALRQLIVDCLHKDRDQRPDALSIKKMLNTNCPFDHVKVAHQVYELHKQVPKKTAFTQDMATQSLFDAVNKYNQAHPIASTLPWQAQAPPTQQWQNSRGNITPNHNLESNQRNPQQSLHPLRQQQESQFNRYGRNEESFHRFQNDATLASPMHGFYNNSGGNLPTEAIPLQQYPFFNEIQKDSPSQRQYQKSPPRLSSSPPLNNQQQQNNSSGRLYGIPSQLPNRSNVQQNNLRPTAEQNQGTRKTTKKNGSFSMESTFTVFKELARNNLPSNVQAHWPFPFRNGAERIKPADHRPRRYLLKFVVLGDKCVGKEKLISSFKKGNRSQKFSHVGQHYNVKVEKGKEKLTEDCDVVIICFTPASRQSYNNVELTWMHEWRNSAAKNASVLLVMTETELLFDHKYKGPLLSEDECTGLANNLKVDYEEYRTNDSEDSAKVFKKAFNLAIRRI